MEAPKDQIKIRSSYNLAGISLNPKDLAMEIINELNGFKIDYKPDFRQEIADTWPNSIDDTAAQEDWNWKNNVEINEIVKKMILGFSQ
jgi:nucleoside-diphosphate-sugar epimerase